MDHDQRIRDLFIIGGGVNGAGIARDAAGRGLAVTLAEMGDIGGATSSASTKLFHGGLRYLEYLEVRLVHEALEERERLLAAMPHISHPMRFVLPYDPAMRFESDTPVSRLMGLTMPWTKGQRPSWMIRAGLFMYDSLATLGHSTLPGTRTVDLTGTIEGAPLRPDFRHAFEYSDGWVDDARLVVLNAKDAARRGAEVLVRTKVTRATREDGLWRITVEDAEGPREIRARALVNAAGPWVGQLLGDAIDVETPERTRLVRGSHIVVPRMFDHDKAYFLQGTDGRIAFAIPYEGDFTLIGTTDAEHDDADSPALCTDAERDYLIAFANRYFRQQLTPEDVVWRFSGVRPLYDDGASSAQAATRDYVLSLDTKGAPIVSVFGGKITTYRRLAEGVLAKLAPSFPGLADDWTAGVALPGGDFARDGLPALTSALQNAYPFLAAPLAARLARAYGTEAQALLGPARSMADLGRDFGAGLTEAELRWLAREEFARTAEDVIWRRTKLGLRLDPAEVAEIDTFLRGLADEEAAREDAA